VRKYNLHIAGYIISFESSETGPELIPSQRFLSYVCSDSGSDVLISVHSDPFELPEDAEKVFHAPLVEETNGTMTKNSDNFWSIYKHRSDLYIKNYLSPFRFRKRSYPEVFTYHTQMGPVYQRSRKRVRSV